jgi:hypothetical protein
LEHPCLSEVQSPDGGLYGLRPKFNAGPAAFRLLSWFRWSRDRAFDRAFSTVERSRQTYQFDTFEMNCADALQRIQDAFRRGRYFIHPHAQARMQQRRITLHDIKLAVANASSVEEYESEGSPLSGASCWRVIGADFDGEELKIGIELTTDHLGDQALVVTVM